MLRFRRILIRHEILLPNMGRKKWGRLKKERRSIAKERIRILLSESEKAVASGESELSNRYGTLARKIARRYKVGLPRGMKVLYCKKCKSYTGGSGSRVRFNKGRVVRTCLSCNDIYRHPLEVES